MGFAVRWTLAIFLAVAVQSSVVYFIAYDGVKPDFVLIFVAFAGILYGRTHGMVIGFFCGLFLDLLNTGMFGFSTFTLLFAGLISGMIQKKVFEDSSLLPIVLIFSFSLCQQFLWNICLLLGGYRLTDLQMLFTISLVKVLYNTFMSLPLLFVFNRVKKAIA